MTPTSCSAICLRCFLAATWRWISAAAKAAIAKVGRAIGLSPEDGAKGIIDIANEVMLGALRVITVQRGLDPRDFGIVAFGGAGPLHANALAELLGCYPVLVPPSPGVLSALGFLEAEFKNEFVQTFIRSTVGLDSQDVWSRFAALGEKAKTWLDEQKVAQGDRNNRLFARSTLRAARLRSHYRSRRPNSSRHPARSTRSLIVSTRRISGSTVFAFTFRSNWLRFASSRPAPLPRSTKRCPSKGPADLASALIEKRPSYFDGAWVDTPNYDRTKLGVGTKISGPAIIRQYDSTTVLLPSTYRRRRRSRQSADLAGFKGKLNAMSVKVDPITLDIIENALKNARFEMDGVVVRISLSPVIREQHDEFPMICNERGQMVVGQFGSYIPAIVQQFENDINDGDIFVWNDPYACKGSISHNNDWCVMMPIFHEHVLVGFSSIFGHMVDVGGKVPGSMPARCAHHLGRRLAYSAGPHLRQGGP